MKKLFILFMLSISGLLFSQEDYKFSDSLETHPIDKTIILDKYDEEMAVYLGGMNALYQYIATHLKYPKAALHKGTEGSVAIRFVIERDGTVSSLKILKDIGDGCGAEAIRVLKLTSGKWKPAKINGIFVRSHFSLPFSFRLTKDTDNKLNEVSQ